MKKKITACILLMLFAVAVTTQAQNVNDCNMRWAGNTLALNNVEGGIYYDVQFSKCTSSGICGWPKIALYHTFTFNVSIGLTLRGVDCDNKVTTSSFSTSAKEIAPRYKYIEQGNWHIFKQIDQVVKVEVSYKKGNDWYQIIFDRDKGINETCINGKSVAAYNAEKQQEQNRSANKTTADNSSRNTTTTTSTSTSTYTGSTASTGPARSTSGNNSSYSNTAGNTASQQRQAVLNNLNTQLTNNRNNYNAVSNGLQELGNTLQQNQARRQAERDAARAAEKQQREEERQQEREENERRAAEQAQIDEQARKEKDRQWEIDKQIIGNKLILNKKTTEIPDNVNQVFYIAYQRNYVTGEVTLNTYTLNQYSDHTWMLFDDLLNKIGFQLYFRSEGVGQLLGFYTNKEEVQGILNRIRNAAKIKSIDDSFLALTPASSTSTSNSGNDYSDVESASLQAKAYSLDSAGNYTAAMKYYQKAAILGNVWAQNNIGALYENGDGVKQDYPAAFEWYMKAAGAGLALAQKNLGSLYESGNGIEQSYTEAIKWYQKAAVQGNTDAMNAIGGLYENGNGVQQDYNEAITWYKKAASQNDAAALNQLGRIYENGWNEAHPFIPVRRSADTIGSSESPDTVIANYLPVTGVPRDEAAAMKWYNMAADQGNDAAMISIGNMYNNGRGVARDTSEAARWYEKAVQSGGARAIEQIAQAYATGSTPDYVNAIKWYRKLGNEKDFWTAQISLGWIYDKGLAGAKNASESARWYEKAAENGGADAMSAIGYYYYYDSPSPDYPTAFKWFSRATQGGNTNTAQILAIMYENGQGTKKNIEEAVKWYRKAADTGLEAAKDALKRLGRTEKPIPVKKTN